MPGLFGKGLQVNGHTPGPWTADSDNYIDSKNGVIAKVEIWRKAERASDAQETAANARLIAAAPELLEALRGVEALVTRYEEQAELHRQSFRKGENGKERAVSLCVSLVGMREPLRALLAKIEGDK